jgi:hypothetical protein
MKKRVSTIIFATVAAGLLASCGGGGGGTTAVTPTPTPTPDPVLTPIVLNLDDPYAIVLTGTGEGLWNFESGGGGGDGGDGGGDGGGGGGDGEFIKVRMKFPTVAKPTGSLTWTVLRSQFGINNNTGTLTIVKDPNGQGGYKVTEVNGSAAAVRATQANFFVSTSGQLSGSFPLPIGTAGAVKDSLFSGVRFKDGVSAASDLSEYAGTYLWANIGAPVGGGGVFIGAGVFRLNADGTGRVCSNTTVWSATCPTGLDLTTKFDDPASRNLLRTVEAKVQSLPIAAGTFTTIDMLSVVRKFGTGGVAITADLVGAPASGSKETAALYASRIAAAPADPAANVGAWNYTNRTAGPAFGQEGSAQFAIANVGGVIKARGGQSPTACLPITSTLIAGPVNGALTVKNPGNSDGYFIQLDVDYGVVVTPNEEIGFVRRYSKDPTKAPCQPN